MRVALAVAVLMAGAIPRGVLFEAQLVLLGAEFTHVFADWRRQQPVRRARPSRREAQVRPPSGATIG